MRRRYPVVMGSSIYSVTGEGDRGKEIMEKIHDKAARYVSENGRDPKYMVLDSQSWLDLYAYHQHSSMAYGVVGEPDGVFTMFGRLAPIVLPQTKTRIQVIGDDPMFTATQTLTREVR